MKVRIYRLMVRNYRGVELLDVKLPPGGVFVQGTNGGGKTSLLHAIQAALVARDVGPDAIRIGEDRAEILVDLGEVTSRRVITEKGTSLTVETSAGDRKRAPQTFLNELLGTAPLDPIELFLASPKERRAIVLGALPIALTSAHVEKWIPAWAREADEAPQTIARALSMHGLEGCALLHQFFYDRRATANRDVKAAREAEARAAEAAAAASSAEAAARAELPPGLLFTPADVIDSEEALRNLRARVAQAQQLDERVDRMRAQVQRLRTDAAADEALSHPVDEAPFAQRLDEAQATCTAAEDALKRAQAVLDEARAALEVAREAAAKVRAANDEAQRRAARAKAGRQQADELEAAIAPGAATPTAADIAAAEARYAAAQQWARVSAHETAARLAAQELEAARGRTRDVEQRAGKLTTVVDALATAAPAALIKESSAIPGLGVRGDAITLDGISIDHVSGREQLLFAVEVARRANQKARILVVDGLERVAPDMMEAFIRAATRDGYQLIASRVAAGDVVLENITIDEAAAGDAAEGTARA